MNTLSMKKVFKNSGNLLSFIFAFIVSIIVIIAVLVFESDMMWFVYLFIGLLVFEFIGALLIILNFRSFNHDVESTKAIVSSTWYMRSRKMITFTYTVNGNEYKKTNALWAWKYVRAIRNGDELEICYKVDHPNKALIKDMYFID